MNSDIRVKISFPRHPKILRLRKQLGAEGPLGLITLWLFAAEMRPDGVLRDMTVDEIGTAAGYPGKAEKFVTALLSTGLLTVDEACTHRLHDWMEHNAYAADSPNRTIKARKAAIKRWYGDAPSINEHMLKPEVAYAPSPSPSPSPSPVHRAGVTNIVTAQKVTLLDDNSFQKLCDLYPTRSGILEGREAASAIWGKMRPEHNRAIRNAKHYGQTKTVQDGYAMRLDKWLAGPYRDYDKPPGDEWVPDLSWQKEHEEDMRIVREEEEKRKRGELPPLQIRRPGE